MVVSPKKIQSFRFSLFPDLRHDDVREVNTTMDKWKKNSTLSSYVNNSRNPSHLATAATPNFKNTPLSTVKNTAAKSKEYTNARNSAASSVMSSTHNQRDLSDGSPDRNRTRS
jgi:hypothetical protein